LLRLFNHPEFFEADMVFTPLACPSEAIVEDILDYGSTTFLSAHFCLVARQVCHAKQIVERVILEFVRAKVPRHARSSAEIFLMFM
jgi:hypothetical protein